MFTKLLILLYADDTVILSESAEDLQAGLQTYEEYCNIWKLEVNTSKTKVIIFSKDNNSNNEFKFKYKDEILEIVSEFKYLGVLFSKNNSFFKTKKHIANQGKKAVYSLLKKAQNMQLPVDLQVELFNKLVKPILLYGCEIWGFGNIDVIERVQLMFIKRMLNLKNSTPNYMALGELGMMPLKIDIYTRMISYWGKINEPELHINNLRQDVYTATHSYYKYSNINNKSFYFKWLHCIRSILCNCGLSGIWENHTFPNQKWLSSAIKRKLIDIYLGEWYQDVQSDENYRLFKTSLQFEPYLLKLTIKHVKCILSFRTRNHKLAVEIGRWKKIDHHKRKCSLCHEEIGDEYHCLLVCKKLENSRKQYIKPFFRNRPNTLKYGILMNNNNTKTLSSLAKFIQVIYDAHNGNLV